MFSLRSSCTTKESRINGNTLKPSYANFLDQTLGPYFTYWHFWRKMWFLISLRTRWAPKTCQFVSPRVSWGQKRLLQPTSSTPASVRWLPEYCWTNFSIFLGTAKFVRLCFETARKTSWTVLRNNSKIRYKWRGKYVYQEAAVLIALKINRLPPGILTRPLPLRPQ